MSLSKFYSDEQLDTHIDILLKRFEKELVSEGYSYTTSTPDKRYKSGKRESSHWVSARYRERKSSERRAFIKQLIEEINKDETLTICKGIAYLNFFIYMRYPLLRNKAQRAIKRRIIKNYKDLPSYSEQLKEFKGLYRESECMGWLIRLILFLGFKKDTTAYEYYKKINTL